jgi:Alw26I/Eco31I/Esp3I family type II restriction m6 adenine DNA methyltransferase
MSKSQKKQLLNQDSTQFELLYSEDTSFRYWESQLFNEVYLRKDLKEKHSDRWESDENESYQYFLKVIRDLASEYKGRERELLNWSETETINNWVKHVIDGLGWKDNCSGVQNPFLEETSFRFSNKTYRTDILIVDHPKQKQYINEAKGDDKLLEARNAVIMPIEVKYWQRLEEYRQGKSINESKLDSNGDDLEKITTPNEQIVQYMNILKKNWGILTDGARWRLFNLDLSSEDPSRYYEFNLYSLIESINTSETETDRKEILEVSKYFYHFFCKDTFFSQDESTEPFVDEILRYSKKYVNKVEEDLKDRFVKAMNIACNGFFESLGKSLAIANLPNIRNVSESALFNVLFVKSLEARGILPMSSTDYKKISLSNTIDKIERFDPDKDQELNTRELERAFKKGNGNSFSYKSDGTELHDRILRLTMVLHDGSKKDKFGFEISGFKESIFSQDEWAFFKLNKLKNDTWVRILFQLGYADSDSPSRKYQQIPYNFFTPRQLGSIYESFLEFTLEFADLDMVFQKRQWQKADLKSRKLSGTKLPIVKKGELFFTPNNKDRKATGSYYTPDAIVQYVVQKTLYPIVKDKDVSDILNIKICDPSMGSGHFLVSALTFLTRAIIFKNNDSINPDANLSLEKVRRMVLDKCIFGVDINSRSVKLAKMSLWLESAQINSKLENLEDQILCGDSLIEKNTKYVTGFSWNKEIFEKKKFQGFTALVGNPPWDKIKSNDLDFFRRYSNTYGMSSGTKNDQEKEKLLRDPSIFSAYEEYQAQNAEMLSYFKNSDDYKNQVVEVAGRKTGGDANKYRLFCERYYKILAKNGRIGIVLPHSVLSDNGATGIRRLFLNEIGIESVIGFENQFEGKEVFPGVARNMKIVCIILNGKGKQRLYSSKFASNPYSMTEDKLVTINSNDYNEFTGERSDILCFPDETSEKINNRMCQVSSLAHSGLYDSLVVKDGEAHMTSAKKYFTESKTEFKLVTGRNFSCFTNIYEIETYVKPAFAEKYSDCKTTRILLKAIMPNSIKKIQAACVPKNHVASNNLFSINLQEKSDEKIKVLLGLLNSDLMEFRIRSLLSNFRLLHRHVTDLPLDKEIYNKLVKSGICKVVESLSGKKENEIKDLKKLNSIIFKAYEISEAEQAYINSYIYERGTNLIGDSEEDASEIAS